jgi:hypothetical protein
MKRAFLWFLVLGLVVGCGKKGGKDASAKWFESPEQVVQGIMVAYETRNDSLYAAFLAENFRYIFEPEGADSADVLTWGKGEEVMSASSLFRTPDVATVRLVLNAGAARAENGGVGGEERWVVPVTGGQLTISVKDKEPTVVNLNRQELVMRRVPASPKPRWQVVEWHDFPTPPPAVATQDTSHHHHGAEH